MRVEQVDFLSVPTRGIARATAWYRDVLGPAPSEHDSEEMEAPNVTRSFWNPLGDSEPFEPNTSGIAFRVDGVESAVGEARAAGAEVIGVEDRASAAWALSRIRTGTS